MSCFSSVMIKAVVACHPDVYMNGLPTSSLHTVKILFWCMLINSFLPFFSACSTCAMFLFLSLSYYLLIYSCVRDIAFIHSSPIKTKTHRKKTQQILVGATLFSINICVCISRFVLLCKKTGIGINTENESSDEDLSCFLFFSCCYYSSADILPCVANDIRITGSSHQSVVCFFVIWTFSVCRAMIFHSLNI